MNKMRNDTGKRVTHTHIHTLRHIASMAFEFFCVWFHYALHWKYRFIISVLKLLVDFEWDEEYMGGGPCHLPIALVALISLVLMRELWHRAHAKFVCAFFALSRTRGLPKCNPFPIVAHTRVSIPKNESIHKIIVRPKYLHRRTIYCFDVWCCVGYYAKCLAHIIYIRSSNYYFSRIKSFAELLDFFFSIHIVCAFLCFAHSARSFWWQCRHRSRISRRGKCAL